MPKNKVDDTNEEEILEDDDEQEVDDESQDETDDEELEDDESGDDETDDDESDDNTDSDEDEDSEEESEEEESDFTKRFTQFKGDTPVEYLKNLEKGYAESSREAVDLSKENKQFKDTLARINQAIAADADLATKLQTAMGQQVTGKPQPAAVTQPTDPAVLWAKSEMERTWRKEYDDFMENHSQVENDPKLADRLDKQIAVVREVVMQTEGRQIGMGEALQKAWKLLDIEEDPKEKVRMAAKEVASQGKSKSAKKDGKAKSKFSDAQISVAMDMMNLSREDALKALSTPV